MDRNFPSSEPATASSDIPPVQRAIELLIAALKIIDDQALGEDVGARVDHAIELLKVRQRTV